MAMYSDAELEALMSALESDLVERKESAADGKKIRRNLGFAQWAVWNVRLEAAAWKSKNRSAEARTKLPEVLTKRGEPYAAVVPCRRRCAKRRASRTCAVPPMVATAMRERSWAGCATSGDDGCRRTAAWQGDRGQCPDHLLP